MGNTRAGYPTEFRRQMVELVRAGRSPEELVTECKLGFVARAPAIELANCCTLLEKSAPPNWVGGGVRRRCPLPFWRVTQVTWVRTLIGNGFFRPPRSCALGYLGNLRHARTRAATLVTSGSATRVTPEAVGASRLP